MSGLGGIQTSDGASPAQGALGALGTALAHRGPDGEARHASGGTALLFTNLQTDDNAAEQPSVEPDGQIVIADGRKALAPGQFETLQSSIPRFAYAGLEPSSERITLARDGFGAKPLYYAETRSGFIFASEPRAILATGTIEAKLRPEGVRELVELQFTTGRETLFSGIYRVLPGETLIADRGHVIERKRVPVLVEGVSDETSDEQLLLRFESLLDDAWIAAFRQTCDPGLLLHEGVESAALLCALARRGARDVPVYSTVSDGPLANEAIAHIETMALAAGNRAVIVPLNRTSFFDLLPRVISRLDDPGADYAAVALYQLAETAARDTRVLISSEGGRTLFGGYGRYRSILRPFWLGGRSMRARGFLEGLGILRDDTPSWRDGLRAAENRIAQLSYTRLQAAQALDCALWLPNDLLMVLDRCLGAHSIELRTPFLDPALGAFGFGLQDRQKIHRSRGSYLIRLWLERHFPTAQAFTRPVTNAIPALRWISEEAARLGPLVAAQNGIAELCDPGEVRRLFERLSLMPQKRLGHAAWQLLFFALWHSIHIEGAPYEGDAFECLSVAAKG